MDAETKLPDLPGYTRKLTFVCGLADGLRGQDHPALAGDRQLGDAYLAGWHAARVWLGDEVPAGVVWAGMEG
jgi:hypothetical protein